MARRLLANPDMRGLSTFFLSLIVGLACRPVLAAGRAWCPGALRRPRDVRAASGPG